MKKGIFIALSLCISLSNYLSAQTCEDIAQYFPKKGWNVAPHYREFSLPEYTTNNSIDEFFLAKGWQLREDPLLEGHLTQAQQRVVNEHLNSHPEITIILETGLNAGHSAENFFQNCKNIKKLISFDDFSHNYAPVAVEFFKMNYGDRFECIQGNSVITMPNYVNDNPHIELDLAFIDGGHSFQTCCRDVINTQKISTPNTILWIDDCGIGEVRNAVEYLVRKRIIIIDTIHVTSDRAWVEAHYHRLN